MRQQTRPAKTPRNGGNLWQIANDDARATPDDVDDTRRNGFFRGLSAAIGGSILVWIVIYLCVAFVAH